MLLMDRKEQYFCECALWQFAISTLTSAYPLSSQNRLQGDRPKDLAVLSCGLLASTCTTPP